MPSGFQCVWALNRTAIFARDCIMGAFLVNFHVRSDLAEQVAEALLSHSFDRVWIAGPDGGWVSFWEEQSSMQDALRIQEIAAAVSRSLETPVIAFLVHDSDFLCYWLYDFGQLQDEYNSCPGYFDDELDDGSLAGDPEVLLRYCLPGTKQARLEEILAQGNKLEMLSSGSLSFVFAEERISAIVPLLGLHEDWARADFNDIGSEVTPEELGARWIGAGEPPEEGESALWGDGSSFEEFEGDEDDMDDGSGHRG